MTELKANPPDLFRRFVTSFSGCSGGNPHSPIWCCGLEWGGGWENAMTEKDFEPCSFDNLQYQNDLNGETFFKDVLDYSSPYCRAIPQILTILKKGFLPNNYEKSAAWLSSMGIIGNNGLAFLLNAYPVSFKGRDNVNSYFNNYQVEIQGKQDSFKNWSKLQYFWLYQKWVIEQRKVIFSKARNERKPKLIINFGVNNMFDFFTLWDAPYDQCEIIEDPIQSASDAYLSTVTNSDNSKTIVCVVPFPSNRGRFNKEAFVRYFKIIRNRCIEEFGENWLDN